MTRFWEIAVLRTRPVYCNWSKDLLACLLSLLLDEDSRMKPQNMGDSL